MTLKPFTAEWLAAVGAAERERQIAAMTADGMTREEALDCLMLSNDWVEWEPEE